MIQIHDELAFSVDSEKEARKICEVMEGAVQLEVPTPADISMGNTWGSLKDLGKPQRPGEASKTWESLRELDVSREVP